MDINFGELLTQGSLSWDASVNYIKGSMTFFGGRNYVALSNNLNKQPDTNPLVWEDYFANMNTATWATMVAQFTSSLNDHIGRLGPTQNVHMTTVGQVGGYTKQEIDAKFKGVNDSFDAHAKNLSNPHMVTPAQVNSLPAATGGTFTGAVTMYQMNIIDGTNYISGVDGIISLGNAHGRLGIKDSLPKNITSGEEYVTDGSYVRVRSKYEIWFSTREPEFEIPLQGSLSALAQGTYTLEFERPSTLNYLDRAGVAKTAAIDEPAFTERGLLLTADTKLRIKVLWSGAVTVQLYRDNIPELWDTSVSNDNLITIVGTTGSISNLRVWQGPLTQYEKSTRGG